MTTGLTEYGRLTKVLVRHARDAFVSEETISSQWKSLNYSGPPDLARALAEHDRFLEVLASSGAEILYLPREENLTLDSIYTRDASVLAAEGVILCRMGKPARTGEPAAQRRELQRHGWPVAGSIESPGMLEGGDLVWLDDRTVMVGEGRRTNAEGISQLRMLLDDTVDELVVIPLPEYPGQHDVLHLMSLISPIDNDLAVAYLRLLPEACQRMLLDRGYLLIDVPDAEFEQMATNVLALGPRDCVMLDGNPRTRSALERAGAQVQVYQGVEVSLKGGGGPTCLTRPLARVG
jgi:N-dimethylarginine dimethylaminohydrolase